MNTNATLRHALMFLLPLLAAVQSPAYPQDQAVSGKIVGTINFDGMAPKAAPLSMTEDRNC